jgi:2-amino-4-hydroxy-6-hydroxymethyldihydropteridine diphosphokinase
VEGELTGYLGLGSNQGDRLAMLRAARSALDGGTGLSVSASSSVYETAPQGEVTHQPDFLNACLRVETELGAEELLGVCKQVERDLGREPGGPRHGPRPIDVDLLLLGDAEFQSQRLTLPHPEVLSRRFVLQPLLELDPVLALPDGTKLADHLDALSDQRVERVGPL